MRRWLIRLAAVIGIVVLGLAGYAGYIAYRIYFHGPGALERMEVAAPTASLRYGPSPRQRADLRVPA